MTPHRPMPRGLLALVAGIALIEVVLSLADAGVLFDPSLRTRLLCVGAFWPDLDQQSTYWYWCGQRTGPLFAAQPYTMLVTHALLHSGLLHMVMNMTILLALGRFVADRYGAGVVLPLFFVGAIAGGAAFALLARTDSPMVGASGAVFAFLGAWIAWDWRRHRTAGLPTAPVTTRVLVLAGINVVLYFGLAGMLAWEAHLGGFVAGVAAGAWLEGRIERAARAEARRRLGGDG